MFLIGASGVILLFAYPAMLSFDIFNYIATAKVTFFYHENPYLIMPIQFVNDPILLFTHSANTTDPYGPLWILITGIPYLLGFNNFLLILFNFKLLMLASYLLASFFVYKLSNNLKVLVLFSLNPLVLIETLVSGHNDMLMIALALGSLYLIKNRIKSLLLYFLSIFIKLPTLFLLPVYVYILVKKIDLKKVFLYAGCLMIIIFFLSPLRKELYPWYAVWFLPFLILYSTKKEIILFTTLFPFALLLTYLPFMYLGQYSNVTLFTKTYIIIIPLVLWVAYASLRRLTRKELL